MSEAKDKNFITEQKKMSDPADIQEKLVAGVNKVFAVESRPRAIKVLTDGNVHIKDKYDNAIIYPVVAGELLQFMPKEIVGATTTSDISFWW